MTDAVDDESRSVLLDVAGDGVATLTLNRPDRHNAWNPVLERRFYQLLEEAGRDSKVSVVVQSVNGMLQFFFTRRKKIQNYRESLQIDWNLYLRHHQLLLDKGIYIHPDNYERITFSSAHSEKDIEKFVSVAHETFKELRTLPRDYLP